MKRNLQFKNYRLPSQLINKVSFSRDQRLISFESPKAFIDFLMKYSFKIIKLCIHKRAKVVNKVRLFHNFGKYLIFLNKHHGALYVVKYLKAAQLSIQRKLAGQPFSSLREIEPKLSLPRLAKCGLPAIIGTRDRSSILSGSTQVIQLYLTLFGLYRVLKAPVLPKLETITSPFSGNNLFLTESLDKFAQLSKKFIRSEKKPIILSTRVLLLQTSSPSCSLSFLGLTKDCVSIVKSGLEPYFIEWMKLTDNHNLLDLFNVLRLKSGVDWSKQKIFKKDFNIGQFAFKEEAAGKLRVFAMVDIVTQSLFKPLHDFLFSVLRRLPNDGTFNQDASFKRAVSKSKVSGHCFGYDLSAATDRLPIAIQVAILTPILGERLAELWKIILIDREYSFPTNPYNLSGSLKYAVGQPMGALSSWAMLAVTHHLIMQYCNILIGKTGWTEDYEVLGDDIVIFCPFLAKKYVEIMSLLGVPLNEMKSVISIQEVPTVEYAKRTSYKSIDVSPISWKMFFNQDTFQGRLSIVSFWWMRNNNFLFSSMQTILQANLGDQRPKKCENSYLSLLTSLVVKGRIPIEWVLAKMSEKRKMIFPFGKAIILAFPLEWAKSVLSYYWRQETPGCKLDEIKKITPTISFIYSVEERYHLASIRKEIQALLNKYGEDEFEALISQVASYSHSHISKRYFRELFFSQRLTFRSMRFMPLGMFQMPQLLKMLRQLQDASSVFDLVKVKPTKKSEISNDLSMLKFIEKSNRKANRADPRICPMTFFTWGQMMFTGFQQNH